MVIILRKTSSLPMKYLDSSTLIKWLGGNMSFFNSQLILLAEFQHIAIFALHVCQAGHSIETSFPAAFGQ